MSCYIDRYTLQYPIYEADIRAKYPSIPVEDTGDTFPVPEEYAVVEIPEAPVIAEYQYLTYDIPELQEDGKWVHVWVVNVLTPEQYNAKKAALAELNTPS